MVVQHVIGRLVGQGRARIIDDWRSLTPHINQPGIPMHPGASLPDSSQTQGTQLSVKMSYQFILEQKMAWFNLIRYKSGLKPRISFQFGTERLL